MAKLHDMIAKSIEANAKKLATDVVAKAPATTVDKPVGTVSAKMTGLSSEQERVADLGFITKTLRGGKLSATDVADLNARAKAVGVTGDLAEALPDGFTGTFFKDIQEELNVAKLFPMKQIKGGVAHDLIALYGIEATLTAEAATGTESGETYMTFVALTNKVMSVVRKSYELLDDSLIDIAGEVRSGIVRAIAEAVETTVINGDIAGTMDAGVAVDSAVRVSNGLRKTGLQKVAIDFGGAAYTEASFLAFINQMQLAGGVYLDERAISRGDVALVIDQHTYANIRTFTSFKTLEVAGRKATLFGGTVDTLFNIPLVVTSGLPAVNASGVIDATPANNTLSTCVMVNIATCRLTANGNVLSEADKVITNQTLVWTGSFRYGWSSVYDSTESATNTINPAFTNVVAGINLFR